MFFYFNYDHTYSYGGSSNGFVTMPTAAMLSGDFTGMPTIYDPSTQTVDSNGIVHRASFASEYGQGNKIPAARMSTVAKALAAYFPAPNVSGASTVGSTGQPQNNYFYNIPNLNPFDKFFGRLDYDITRSNRLTISESNQNNNRTIGAIICPISCQIGSVAPNFSQVSDVWTFSPRFLNEARMGYAHELDLYVPVSLNQGYAAKLGWQLGKQDLPPGVSINNIYGFGPASNAVYKEFAFDPSDIVTLIRGKHVLHFGGEFLVNRADSTAWGNINAGSLDFSGTYTSGRVQDPTTGAYTSTGGLDLANSDWDDLVLVNGHVYPQVDDAQRGTHYREPGLVFLNQHNGAFQLAPASALSTLAEPHVSRGLATADLFNRGALDLVVENLEGAPLILSSQPPPNTHWISLALQAKPGQPTILNTRVRLVAGGNTQMQEVRSGGSYLSQSDLRLHFGLGSSTRIDRLEVLWPGGKKQTFANVAPDCFYTLSPGGDLQPAPHTPS